MYSAPYKKLKSISTGDLLDTGKNADWLLKCTSPDSMERRVILAVSTADPDDYRFTVCHCLEYLCLKLPARITTPAKNKIVIVPPSHNQRQSNAMQFLTGVLTPSKSRRPIARPTLYVVHCYFGSHCVLHQMASHSIERL